MKKFILVFLFITVSFSTYGQESDPNSPKVQFDALACQKLLIDQVQEAKMVEKVKGAFEKIIDAAQAYIEAQINHYTAIEGGSLTLANESTEIMGNSSADIQQLVDNAANDIATGEYFRPKERIHAWMCVQNVMLKILRDLNYPGIPCR